MLGGLKYTPAELGRCRLGEIFDAIAGYNDKEEARYRSEAALIRHAATLLWNTQVTEDSRKEPEDLWRFPWEKEEPEVKMSEEEEKRIRDLEERQKKILENM